MVITFLNSWRTILLLFLIIFYFKLSVWKVTVITAALNISFLWQKTVIMIGWQDCFTGNYTSWLLYSENGMQDSCINRVFLTVTLLRTRVIPQRERSRSRMDNLNVAIPFFIWGWHPSSVEKKPSSSNCLFSRQNYLYFMCNVKGAQKCSCMPTRCAH